MGIAALDQHLPARSRPLRRSGRVVLIPSTREHVGWIAARMRATDRQEVAALGHSPRDALLTGLRDSTVCLTAKIDGKPEAMCGVAPGASLADGSAIGVPWMLATDAVTRHGRAFLSHGQVLIRSMLGRYDQLENCVWAENERAITLLRRLGFILAEVPISIGGLPFLHFAMSRRAAVV